MPLPFPRHERCGKDNESPMFMSSPEGKDRVKNVCEVGGGEGVDSGGGK